ncbi:MAG: PrsW family intramembrane metalloprotease [Anaerolineales bacterium]|nr:PrsW family intramembrane metalloprotease [Anaerolineales bacterium]
MIIAISLGIALIVPVVFLFLLRKFDLFQTGQFRLNIVTLICGIIAYYLAAQINPALVNAGWTTWGQVIRIWAPIIEEVLKSLIIIYLVTRADFNYVVDGAIYGFGAGIGFAMIENVEYVTGNAEIALVVALARVFSTNLVHATGSGLIGTALANRRGDKSYRAWLIILLGYIFSIVFHGLFNTMVSAGTLILFAIGYGVVGIGLIYYVIRRGLNIQKEWVAEKLGMADRVTVEETKVVKNIETIHEILLPVEKRFGVQKSQLVRSLIYKQAEIGIKRKLLDTDTSASRKIEVNKIIEGLTNDINVLRNQIGPYCMMMVRQVYLGQDTQVWNLLNTRIAAAGLGQKGGGLWDRVTERVGESTSQENKL